MGSANKQTRKYCAGMVRLASEWRMVLGRGNDIVDNNPTTERMMERTTGKNVSPLDFLKQDTEFADKYVQEARYDICLSCDRLTNVTKQCRECGCFMKLKVKLAEAVCPIGKW